MELLHLSEIELIWSEVIQIHLRRRLVWRYRWRGCGGQLTIKLFPCVIEQTSGEECSWQKGERVMNTEEVAKLCEALTLKENEGPVRSLRTNLMEDGMKRLGYKLVGKLLSTKLVNRETCTMMIPKILRTVEDIETEVIAGNMFSFTFKSVDDRQ
ncbi:hypothetical protein Ddye_009388 [Dipteronia dyeriana]|uniref:Uncharacterized protein n=1 Tax=Dipteronia dyeriana TaxID=168575 RepID=A0AAE0CM94_9ROSI|nr:hypothetical protein Ddye_009388 [Dipteronia dyeriana]